MLWLVKIWQVSSCGKFMQHLKSCLLWQLKLTEFLSFSTGCTKMKYSCYQQSLVKVGNPISDGIVFVFHLAWKAWSNTAISGKTTHNATTELILSLLVVRLSSQLVSKLYVWISVTPKGVREWWTGWRPLAKTTSEHTSINAGNNVTTAEMKEALLSYGGVEGVWVAILLSVEETVELQKVSGISKINNFLFTEDSLQAWRTYAIDPGKTIASEKVPGQCHFWEVKNKKGECP